MKCNISFAKCSVWENNTECGSLYCISTFTCTYLSASKNQLFKLQLEIHGKMKPNGSVNQASETS